MDSTGHIITDGEGDISDQQFKNYVRRDDVKDFMNGFDSRLTTLDTTLNNTILALRRKGTLAYKGAVELQSSNTRRLSWNVPSVLEVGLNTPMYAGMSYAEG